MEHTLPLGDAITFALMAVAYIGLAGFVVREALRGGR
jgi:hypothetical protein